MILGIGTTPAAQRVMAFRKRVTHRLARSEVKKRRPRSVRRLSEITSRQQQTQRRLLDWLRAEYEIEKPSNKLLAVAEIDSDTWV